MMDLMNSQRVKDIYKGYRKIIIGKGKEEINESHKDQPGKRITAEVMETKRRVLTLFSLSPHSSAHWYSFVLCFSPRNNRCCLSTPFPK